MGKGIRFQFSVGERKVLEELVEWKMLPPSWKMQSSRVPLGKPATFLWSTCSPSIREGSFTPSPPSANLQGLFPLLEAHGLAAFLLK